MNNELTQFSTADTFFKEHGHEVSLIEGDLIGWRTRAKLAVRGTVKNPLIGLFKPGTHDVVPLLDCPMHHPSINEGFRLLKDAMIRMQVAPYDEVRGSGILRYVQMVVERRTGRIQLVLVVQEAVDALVEELRKLPLWHSIWLNVQRGSTNSIFGKEWLLCHGEEELWENLSGHDFCFHPACFAQAHLSLFEKMLVSIKENILPQKRIVEFYAGVGVIGLSLLEKAHSLALNEINSFSENCFNKSLTRMNGKASFYLGFAEEHTSLLEHAEVVIVDPPRKGISMSLKEEICKSSAEQLVYISCNWNSFHRDCLYFLERGWNIEKAETYLFFPGTDEVEILCFLRKNSG